MARGEPASRKVRNIPAYKQLAWLSAGDVLGRKAGVGAATARMNKLDRGGDSGHHAEYPKAISQAHADRRKNP